MKVYIKLVKQEYLPEFKHKNGDACLDCKARLNPGNKIEVHADRDPYQFTIADNSFMLAPKVRVKIPLGFSMQLPEHTEAIIRPRSGLSLDGLYSYIGTIDSNYCGEVCAIVENRNNVDILIEDKMRLCQLAIREIPGRRETYSLMKLEEENKFLQNNNNKSWNPSDELKYITNVLHNCLCEMMDNSIEFEIVDSLENTDRGSNGFGSTGV